MKKMNRDLTLEECRAGRHLANVPENRSEVMNAAEGNVHVFEMEYKSSSCVTIV